MAGPNFKYSTRINPCSSAISSFFCIFPFNTNLAVKSTLTSFLPPILHAHPLNLGSLTIVVLQEPRRQDGPVNSVSCLLIPQTGRRGEVLDPWRSQHSPAAPEQEPVPEFSRKHLRLIKKIGEGRFGLVSTNLV